MKNKKINRNTNPIFGPLLCVRLVLNLTYELNIDGMESLVINVAIFNISWNS